MVCVFLARIFLLPSKSYVWHVHGNKCGALQVVLFPEKKLQRGRRDSRKSTTSISSREEDLQTLSQLNWVISRFWKLRRRSDDLDESVLADEQT